VVFHDENLDLFWNVIESTRFFECLFCFLAIRLALFSPSKGGGAAVKQLAKVKGDVLEGTVIANWPTIHFLNPLWFVSHLLSADCDRRSDATRVTIASKIFW
jgi:hypothetical protein